MKHNVVCISSPDGAGAQEAAALAAGSLDFRLIDEDIVARAALEAGVDHAVVADVERRKSLLVKLVEGLGSANMGAAYAVGAPIAAPGEPPNDALMGMIRSVIEEFASSGSAVIVAHAASLALGGREDVLRVLITASPNRRQERLASALGADEKEAARAVKRGDAGRADYLKRFYGINAELPIHYDLVINTDKLTPDLAAALIVQAAGG